MNDYTTELRLDEMTKTCRKGLFLSMAVLFIWASIWSQAESTTKRAQSRMDAAAKKAVVDSIAELLSCRSSG
jgi:hypothetical protein